MIEGMLFDLDGLLIDSERMFLSMWEMAEKEFNVVVDKTWAKSVMGRNAIEAVPIFIEYFGDKELALQIRKYRSDMIAELYLNGKIPLKDGARNILQFAHDRGYRIALATSSPRDRVEAILKYWGIDGFFDGLITGDMVSHGKPDPEVFAKALELISVKPENAVVLEDSKWGIMAAYTLGIRSIFVQDMNEPDNDVVSRTAYIYHSLNEVINDWGNIIN